MKKVFAVLAILGVFAFGMTSNVLAQEGEVAQEETVQNEASVADEATAAPAEAAAPAVEAAPVAQEEVGMYKALKIKFIEGGAGFMACVALCLIIGLALCIERIIYLSLASANTKKLLQGIEDALNENDTEKAKEICRNTRGYIASIFYQGISRIEEAQM